MITTGEATFIQNGEPTQCKKGDVILFRMEWNIVFQTLQMTSRHGLFSMATCFSKGAGSLIFAKVPSHLLLQAFQ